jgi:hypothetical protein
MENEYILEEFIIVPEVKRKMEFNLGKPVPKELKRGDTHDIHNKPV